MFPFFSKYVRGGEPRIEGIRVLFRARSDKCMPNLCLEFCIVELRIKPFLCFL